ncbi:tyrosine-type recombinase/integrase [uncultured Maribacter sp.]|uniref:tyrosine-type recombinase/integrase n=1 Tax=uncultured Maribacter sp. TaxID=431308 RepID=UPI00262D3D6E|nr:tyrosine-type recombinase/integrase [uncultured Maribacter sp.]
MSVIYIEPFYHKKEAQIAFRFKYNYKIKEYIKQLNNLSWSSTNKTFYIKNTPNNKVLVHNHLKNTPWKVDYSAFKKNTVIVKPTLTRERLAFFNDFKKFLIGKRYSESTIGVYSGFVYDFLAFLKNVNLKELTNKHVELFVEEVIVAKAYSISTHRQLISALKQFTLFYPETALTDLELKRPKKSKKLPSVLSQEEVIDLIRCTKNLKHRAILGLLYSAGMRIGELTSLKLRNIHVDRKQIFIENGKGRKDRYVVLADSFMPLLKNYFTTYKPTTYFVEGNIGKPYSESSIRKFLQRSCKAAGINKHVTPHTLRHSYATHLLENGIGLRHIQELLGHSKPETTMIYTHVAKKDLLDIRSPLDIIVTQLTKTNKREQNVLLSRNL